MKWLKNLGVFAFLTANARVVFRVLLAIVLFLAVELIYSKYRDPSLNLSDEQRFYFLIGYSLIQLAIVFWVIFSLRYVVWGKKKIIEVLKAKASFKKVPQNLQDLSDISKNPEL